VLHIKYSVPVKAVGRRETWRVVLAVAAHRNGLSTCLNAANDPLLHAKPVGIDHVVHVDTLKSVQRRTAACRDVEMFEELQQL
jgi:hypothetical protein